MGLYSQFETDENAETKGIHYLVHDDDGEDLFRVLLARAGGANKKFDKSVDAENKRYSRQIANESFSTGKGRKVMIGVYADTIILNWEVKVGEKWVQAIDVDEKGVVTVPYNRQNVIDKLTKYRDLYTDIATEANRQKNFKKAEQEADAKN